MGQRILLFQPDSLGDSFFTASLSQVIKKEKPESKVSFLSSKPALEMMKDSLYIDEFIPYTGKLLLDIKNLRKRKFDFIIDTWGVGDSYYRVFFSKAKRKVFLQKKESEKYLIPLVYTESIKFNPHGYVFWDRIELLRVLDINVDKYIGRELPEYFISEQIKEKIKLFLDKNKINKFFLLSPKALWKTKDIPIDLAVDTIKKIENEFNLPTIVAVPPSDLEYGNQIANKTKSLIFSSKSIREFGALINESIHLISVESLPYHLAVGLRKSATVILGGYPIWKPSNYDKLNFVNIDMDCKFCSSHKCKIGTYECLTDITGEMVIKKVKELIK